MAKLTEEQKQANKEKDKILRAEFNKRRKEYEAAKKKALNEIELSSLKKELEAAYSKESIAREAMIHEELIYKDEIYEIQEKIKQLRDKHHIDSIAEERKSASIRLCAASNEAMRKVAEQYSDIAEDCYCFIRWKHKRNLSN
jgi:FMN phosphatase YigB (HAD superfamily)